MKYILQIILSIVLVIIFHSLCRSQTEFDYGIGMVILPGGDYPTATIFSKPNLTSDTLAIYSDAEFTIYPNRQKARAFLVGFRKYDYWGLPLLSFTKDSAWAKVSIQSRDTSITLAGWVSLKVPNTLFRIWANYLATEPMVLRRDQPLRFYSRPDTNAIWNIKVAGDPNQGYSYVLRPIRREGRFLLVELKTPFWPCGDNPEEIIQQFAVQPKTVRVWIQYLDNRMRPLVKAPQMC
jgi:hypothetical protein